MQEIGKVLSLLFQGYFEPGNPRMIELLAPFWPRVAGKVVAAHSRLVSFESGLLTVAASDPDWGRELDGLSEQIKSELNSYWGRALVKKVRIIQKKGFDAAEAARLRPAKELRRPAEERPKAPVLPLPDSGARLDPEMQEILARSYAKYFARAGRNPV